MKRLQPPEHGNRGSQGKPPGESASMVALFITILLLSVGLALWTDLHIILRGVITILCGIAAAAVTFIVVRKRYAAQSSQDASSTKPPADN